MIRNTVKNPLDYKQPLAHELYLALNLLYEETMDGVRISNLKLEHQNSMRFARRVIERYRRADPKDDPAVRQRLFDQALVELQKAMNLIEAPHWQQSRRWDVLDALASVRNTMREMEEHLHARTSN